MELKLVMIFKNRINQSLAHQSTASKNISAISQCQKSEKRAQKVLRCTHVRNPLAQGERKKETQETIAVSADNKLATMA